ncbi:MAG: NAD(P)H-dependent oxidoreductase subunit E [Gaiellales bacterium]
MDIKLLDVAPTEAEKEAVDLLLGPPLSGWDGGERDALTDTRVAEGGHEAREERHLLLPVLWAVQDRIGYISAPALAYISKRLMIPPAEVYGVATFYMMLATEPTPPRVLHVCEDIACKCHGSDDLIATLEERFGPEGAVSADGRSTWHRSPCLGQCDRAPAVLMMEAGLEPFTRTYAPASSATAFASLSEEEAAGTEPAVPNQLGDSSLRLLRRIGVVDPWSIDDYRAKGGYDALRRAVALGPAGVIREVKDSRLMGRGGAAFPTGVKWEAVAQQPARPKFLICNADESEPGTFKDRVILEGDPFSLVESMTIAAYAMGIETGFIYLRGEYPEAERAVQNAIDQAYDRGLLGDDIMGEGFTVDLEIRRGAGAYICGEETAIFNSIEGFRGEPRSKPPFPVEKGVFQKPTAINNVETLINVLDVIMKSGPGYAEQGTQGSTGTKLFCLSGCVTRPGVYEVPFGGTLRELIDMAGGVPDGRELQAVLLGGAAGSFVRADELDIELSFEAVREAKTTLGSGVVMVFDDTVNMHRILQRIAQFFRNESCGQCVPCRVGTVRQQEALARLASGRPRESVEQELELIAEIGGCMRDASICGLGQAASSAVESAIDRLGVFKGGVQ